jgi:hypothetical protein
LSFLTSKLTAKSKPGQHIKHVELPALSDQPNNQIMSTNSALDEMSQPPSQETIMSHNHQSNYTTNQLTLNLSEQYNSAQSQDHKRIRSMLTTEQEVDPESADAFRKVQELVAATTPKADLPFSHSKHFEFSEADEPPTAATTGGPVTKTTDGDYSNVRQTTSTQPQMEVIEEEDDGSADILAFI